MEHTTIVAGVLKAATENTQPMGAGEDAVPILPYLPEFIFGLIAFGILYFFVAKKIVPTLERVYAERTDAIEGGMQAAEKAQAEAAAAKKGMTTRFDDEFASAPKE